MATHYYDSDSDRCICGGVVVYHEPLFDLDAPAGEGCEIAGVPWGHEEKPTRTWNCKKCGRTVERYRGMDDVQCECGTWYNSFGQRLRDDWQGNPSNYDEDVSDLDGYEMQYAGDE